MRSAFFNVSLTSEVAYECLLAGLDIDSVDQYGLTALMYQASLGSLEACNILLNQGASHCLTDSQGKTALHYAATAAVTAALISAKANIHAQDSLGETALLSASRRSAGVTRELLNAKADPYCRSQNGKNALHWASEQGKKEIVQLLLASDSENGGGENSFVNSTDLAGYTPLHFASLGAWPKYETHLYICTLLLEHKANVHCHDSNGMTPLHIATDSSGTELLLLHKADPAARDNDGEPRCTMHL